MSDEMLGQGPDGQLVITTPLISKLDAIQREQAAGFAGVREALNGKADKADVARVETRMEGQFQEHHRRISDLEQQQRDTLVADGVLAQEHGKLLTRREKIWGGVGIAILALSSLLGAALSAILGRHG
jgi:hypothetical protein